MRNTILSLLESPCLIQPAAEINTRFFFLTVPNRSALVKHTELPMGMVSANERRYYMCNIFSHWLRSYSWELAQRLSLVIPFYFIWFFFIIIFKFYLKKPWNLTCKSSNFSSRFFTTPACSSSFVLTCWRWLSVSDWYLIASSSRRLFLFSAT